MGKVLCFGEILLRMSPVTDGEWLKNASMPVYVGGSELNVAAALAKWNLPVAYCTSMPGNYLGLEILGSLRDRRIDISPVLLGGDRMGIYYLPMGKDLKNAGVIYDRAYSSFSELKAGALDWDMILEGVSWLHFSAISPALNEQVAAVCLEALRAASKKNLVISVDLNHRPKLWQYGQKPVDVMRQLMPYCDVVMGNIWSAHDLLGTEIDEGIHDRGEKACYLEHAHRTSLAIQGTFPRCRTVAHTFRFHTGDQDMLYYASLFSKGSSVHSPEFSARDIVSKIGTGDCFMAGLIYGLCHQNNAQQVVNFAAAAAFGKMYERGDLTDQDVSQVNEVLHRFTG